MTASRKAVILARGLGTRMKRDDPSAPIDDAQARAADAGVKGMIPIGRPFLDYVISALADAGLTDVCLVIGPEHDAIRAHYGHGLSRVRVHVAVQAEPRGTADAVAAAESFAANDTVLVLNADNYYPVAACRALAGLGASGLVGFEPGALVSQGNIPAERVRAFALVTTDLPPGHNAIARSGRTTGPMPPAPGRDPEPGVASFPLLTDIVEKPDAATYTGLATRSLVSMNLWSFTPAIFEACRLVQPSPRGELELQDAVRIARTELGEPFFVIPFAGPVLDLSSRGDIPAVASALEGIEVHL